MDDDSSVCQSCGAMLPLPDLAGVVTCPSCGRHRRVSAPGAAAGPRPDRSAPGRLPDPPPLDDGGWPAPPVLAPDPDQDWQIPPGGGPGYAGTGTGTVAGRGTKVAGATALGCGCLPGLLVLVVLGVVGFFVFRATDSVQDSIDRVTGSGGKNLMALSGTATVLGSGDGGSVDLVGVVQDNSSSTRTVTRYRLTPEGPQVRWTGPAIGSDVYDVDVAQVGATVFAGVGDELWALDANTGTRRWSASLSDATTNGCDDCFAAVGGTLVVRTQDAEVAAYGEASAEPRWSRRLTSPSGTVTVAGDALVISDEPATPGAGSAMTVDPATGKVLRTVRPACPEVPGGGGHGEQVMGVGIPLAAVPGSSDVVGVFGFGDSCAVRWDPASGTIRFATRIEGLSTIGHEAMEVAAQDLVLGRTSSPLVHVALDTGRVTTLPVLADQSAEPIRIVGRTLIAGTTTTRGSTKGGLAAWDLASGTVLWNERLPDGAQPVSRGPYRTSDALFDGSPRTLLAQAGKQARLFTFDGTSRTLSVDALDLATGARTEVVEVPWRSRYASGGTPSLTVEAITATRVVFSVDGLLQSIAASGEGEITSFPDLD